MTTTYVLETAGTDIAYDVRGSLPTADGRPPLFMIGQPMDARCFDTLASCFPDRLQAAEPGPATTRMQRPGSAIRTTPEN
jgi:hypothetical protein